MRAAWTRASREVEVEEETDDSRSAGGGDDDVDYDDVAAVVGNE